jgi:hypothetical protein
VFEIKYTIFPDDVVQLRTLDLTTFERDFSNIYGTFTLVVDGKEYIPYPDNLDIPVGALRLFSELLVTHFEMLVEAAAIIETSKFVAMKYPENNWTWLELRTDGDLLSIREVSIESQNLNELVVTNEKLLQTAEHNRVDHIHGELSKADFKQEIHIKVRSFLREINEINTSLLECRIFTKLKAFIACPVE